MAANFVFQAMMALQLDFYTKTYGLTPAQAGTMFLDGRAGLGGLQSRDGRDCRPHPYPLGQISPLAAVDRSALWRDRRSDLYHAGFERRRQADVCLGDLSAAAPDLCRQQRALCLADRR